MNIELSDGKVMSLDTLPTETLWNLIINAQNIIRKREKENKVKEEEHTNCDVTIEYDNNNNNNNIVTKQGDINLTENKKVLNLETIDYKMGKLKRKLFEISESKFLDKEYKKRVLKNENFQTDTLPFSESKIEEDVDIDTQEKQSSIDDRKILLSTDLYDEIGKENINTNSNITNTISIENLKRPNYLPPFVNFNKNVKDESKDISYYPNVKIVDELLNISELKTMKTILQKEDAREKNLIKYITYYEENYFRKLISLKNIPINLKICLNYNPIRLKPWRIQDFKLNQESDYYIKKEYKKTRKYWEQEKIIYDEFTDEYFNNFYKYFDNLKNVDNPLQLNERIAYPNTQELKEDKHYMRIYEYNNCKKMLLLALNHTIPREQRGYLFRKECLNNLVSTGLFNIENECLLISFRKEIEEY